MPPPGFTREDPGQPPTLVEAYRSTVLRAPREPPIRTPQTLTEITGPAGPWDRLGGPPVVGPPREGADDYDAGQPAAQL